MSDVAAIKKGLWALLGSCALAGCGQFRPTAVLQQSNVVARGVSEDIQVLPPIEYLPPVAEPPARATTPAVKAPIERPRKVTAEPRPRETPLAPSRPIARHPGATTSNEPPPLAGPQAAPAIVSRVPGEPPQIAGADTQNQKLPITLDTVLQLAQDQNGQIGVAREKLQEAFMEEELAAKRWLPDLYLGAGYGRHEGGIQDFDGQLLNSSFGSLFAGVELQGKFDLRDAAFQKIDAARKVWQQKGELSKLTSETLLDASSTYIDLLAARSGYNIAKDIENKLRVLAKRARELAQVEKGTQVEVSRVNSEITAQQQVTRKLREGERGAAAKLSYVLGLDPAAELVPLEKGLIKLKLVDTSVSVEELVNRAHTNGPGIREVESLLAVIDQGAARARGMGTLIPIVEVNVVEGLFGAGPGSRSDWDNRFDLCVHARWNLTELVTARQRRCMADSKIQQAHLSYQDLRGKLSLGVREAYEANQSAAEQARIADEQVKHALDAYKLSDERLKNNIKGASPSEVLLSIRTLWGAQLNRVHVVREFDKAQLRLLVLLGAAAERHQEPPPIPVN